MLEKENDELKKRLKSAEQSDYVTPLRDRVDVCEEKINELVEKINEHESDLDNAYTDIDIVDDKVKTVEADLDDFKKRYFNGKQELQQVRKDVTDLVNSVNSVRLDTTSNTDTIRELQDIYGGEIDIINKILYRHDGTIRECQKTLEDYTEAYKQLRTSLDNTDNALERRIKAIEKRLSIKPFYEPTEDEKDD